MHKFSLENIKNGIKTTLNRFPIPMIVAGGLTIIGLILVDLHDSFIFQQFEFTLGLTLLLTIAAKLYTENHPGKSAEIQAYGVTAIIVIAFYFFGAPHLTSEFTVSANYVLQYVLWMLAGLLAIAFAPALRKPYTEFHFWKYMSRLGGAAVMSIVYSAILFGGLAIAFGTVSFLFNLNFEPETFLRLWIVIAGLITPMIFLNHTPRLENIATEQGVDYPVALRNLCYYVLIPLVCIYFAILYVYTAKVLITMTWPKGVISVMILGFSSLGLFIYMVLYPIIKETPAFTKAAKTFFILLIPQIVVLFYAVFLRINEYAWTPQRYIVVAGSIWLLLITLYVLFSKIKNLKFFFTSLFVFVVLSSFGPWGMFNVSAVSQINRLETILVRNNILVDGKIQKVTRVNDVPDKDIAEIGAIARYLARANALSRIEQWFPDDLRDDVSVTRLIGVPMWYSYENGYRGGDTEALYAQGENTQVQFVKGFDYLIRDITGTSTIANNVYEFVLTKDNVYEIYKNKTLIASFPLQNFIDSMVQNSIATGKPSIQAGAMGLALSNSAVNLRLNVNTLYNWSTETKIYGTLLITFK